MTSRTHLLELILRASKNQSFMFRAGSFCQNSSPYKKRYKKQESFKSDLKLSCDSDGARTHDPQLRRLLL